MDRKRTQGPGLERKLAMYAVAGGAALAVPVAAHGGPIYSGLQNITVTSTGPTLYYQLDLDANWVVDFTLAAGASSQQIGIRTYGSNAYAARSGGAAALSAGALIDGSNSFGSRDAKLAYRFMVPSGNWPQDGSQAYLGLRFAITDAALVNHTHYSWARLSTTITSSMAEFTVHDWAYNDIEDEGILAGQTTSSASAPEPSSIALFALGAAGVIAVRRRRKARTAT